MRRLFSLALSIGILSVGFAAVPALASDIRSVVADAYGNAIIRTQGGAKIIAVGQAALANDFVPDEAQAADGQNCRYVGIVLKGRSFMYGVSDGDPVPVAAKLVCD